MPSPDDMNEAVTSPLDATHHGTPVGGAGLSNEVLRSLGERYDILDELGRGGMGIVFRARDRETGDTVALKVLRPEIANNPELLERFKAELLLARKVTHKNVCRVHELIRLGNVAAIAMEYVEGESLRAILRREQGVSVRYALKLTRQILSGLREAHEQGVVHRDLKPENILIARDGTVKVMDFGIALSASAPATQEGGIAGTPAYMSPEQAQGKPADARSDIYSLGLCLYELFCGAPAFTAETTTDLLKKQVTTAPTPPRAREPNLPDYLERVILKCLAKEPARRFQSIAELQTALEEQQPLDLTADEEPVVSAAESTWGKRDIALFAVAVIAVLTFLMVRDKVFPLLNFALEIDSLAARREAARVIARIGRVGSEVDSVQMEYHPDVYTLGFFQKVFHERGTPAEGKTTLLETMRQAELPLTWVVDFRTIISAPTFGGVSDQRIVRLDHSGRVLEIVFPVSENSVARDYKAPPVEQRRARAVSAVKEACGEAPPETPPVETAGGPLGAQYSASWKQQKVDMVAEQITLVRCSLFLKARPPEAVSRVKSIDFMRFARAMGFMFVGFLFVGYSVLFVKTRAYRLPVLWKRLAPAALAGLPAGWLLAPALSTATPGIAEELLGGLAVTAVMWIGLVGVEAILRKRLPDSVASWRLLLNGKLREPAVGLSTLRGVLMGFILVGLQTIIFFLSLVLTPSSQITQLPPPLMLAIASYLDPAPVGFAMASGWPAVFVVCSAIFHGMLVGFLCLGLALQDVQKWLTKFTTLKNPLARWLKPAGIFLLVGMNVAILAAGLRLHFSASIGLAFSIFLVPVLTTAVLAWFFQHHGALAAVMAVATLIIVSLNFPLVFMLREVGNGPQFVVFGIWAALISAACWSGFRGRWVQSSESSL